MTSERDATHPAGEAATGEATTGEAGSTRVVVRRGRPDEAELTALAMALAHFEDEAAEPSQPRTPAWLRAARLESLGAAPLAAPHDLPPSGDRG